MDKIKEILDIILSEAEEQAEQILKKAEAEIAKNRSQTDLDIFELTEQINDQISVEVDAIYTRNESMIENKTRQLKLAQRQALIQSIIDQATKKFSNMPDEEKIALYQSMIKSRGIDRGEILLNQTEQYILPDLLAALGSSFTAGAIAPIKGGLLLVHDRIEENLSIDLILRDKRTELSSLAANILFD